MVKLAASILSADFSRLGEEILRVEKHVDSIHFDVMDGHFVPNITFGPMVLKSIRSFTKKPIEVHLMVESPQKYVEELCQFGADMITVHVESDRHIQRTLGKVRELGKSPAVALNPSTPVSVLKQLVDDIDVVVVMGVNPGFGGQEFIRSMVPKIRSAKSLVGNKAQVEVDGGINLQTAALCKEAGADILVSGSFLLKSKNIRLDSENLKK